jgi:hypothetical protein
LSKESKVFLISGMVAFLLLLWILITNPLTCLVVDVDLDPIGT